MMHRTTILGLRWLPVVFLAVMVGIWGYAWRALGQSPALPDDALKAEQTRIGYEQDALEKRVAMLQAQLGWVLAAVGLFTLIQGAFAALGAYNFVQQADRIMGDIKDRQVAVEKQLTNQSRQMTEGGEAAVKKIEELAVDVRAQYPMFHKAEQARREAFESLSRLNENGDWRDNLYEQLGVHERQRLLSVENFVGLEFLESGRDTARNLRLMGNFYASKYVYERRTNPTDLDRAQYYLELALTRTGRAFRQLNDYGALHLVFMQPAKLDIAESQFMESREKWKHQRAAYNLASIALDRGNGASARPEKVKHYSKAHGLLKEALGNDVWELTKSIEREGSIHYNLACCLARLSECDESVDANKRLAETLAELEAAARAGVPKLDVFSDDLNVDDGDLGALSRCADPIIRSELSRIRSLLGEI